MPLLVVSAARSAAPRYEQPVAAPAAPAQPADDPIAKLNQLAELKDQGALTDEEFAAAKAKIIDS